MGSRNRTDGDTVEKRVLIVHVILKDADVLEDLSVYLDLLVVPDGIFTKEVEGDQVRRLQCNMFASQRTTADCIRLIFALLITSTKRELVDEIHRRCALTLAHVLALQCFIVVETDLVDVILDVQRSETDDRLDTQDHLP